MKKIKRINYNYKKNASSALLANRHRQSKKALYKLFDSSRYSVDLILRRLPDSFYPKLVCDIGAGYGALAINFALKGIKTVAIEPLKEDRKLLKQIMEKHPSAKMLLKVIDAKAEKLPVKNASIDLCILSQVLEHVENPMETLKEASRVLKTGGYLYLASPNYIFPMEQHYRLLYLPLMPKELLYSWVLFYFKFFKKQTFKKEELKDISNFIIGLNYTRHKMVDKLFKKNHLKIIWSASSENSSILTQILKHWKANPRITSIPLLFISLPLKISRAILTCFGFLPKKLEYVAVKVK